MSRAMMVCPECAGAKQNRIGATCPACGGSGQVPDIVSGKCDMQCYKCPTEKRVGFWLAMAAVGGLAIYIGIAVYQFWR